MARAYSDDLRRKFLEAYDRGDGSLRLLAERFGVSYVWGRKISAQRRRSGQMERLPQSHHGRRSRVTSAVEAALVQLAAERSDRTLAEWVEALWRTTRERFSPQHLWRVLLKLGLRRKKNHFMRRNRTVQKVSGSGRRGGRKSPRSPRHAWSSSTKAA
jgi:transposase